MLNNRRKRFIDRLELYISEGDRKEWYEDEGFIALLFTLLIMFFILGWLMYFNNVSEFEDKNDLTYYNDILGNR